MAKITLIKGDCMPIDFTDEEMQKFAKELNALLEKHKAYFVTKN